MSGPALAETEFLDFSAPQVADFVGAHLDGETEPRRQAVRLFYAVRDSLFYEIYNADFARTAMTASAIIRKGSGLCIHKSIVYAALLRRIGIPARLVFYDVRNHLCSPNLARIMGGDVFHYHCLVALRLYGSWIKATPVFNKRLCQLYKMAPLDFDGRHDCVHHPFDEAGRQHMEIIREHGAFDDHPYQMIIDGLRRAHPGLFAGKSKFRAGSLVRDAGR